MSQLRTKELPSVLYKLLAVVLRVLLVLVKLLVGHCFVDDLAPGVEAT